MGNLNSPNPNLTKKEAALAPGQAQPLPYPTATDGALAQHQNTATVAWFSWAATASQRDGITLSATSPKTTHQQSACSAMLLSAQLPWPCCWPAITLSRPTGPCLQPCLNGCLLLRCHLQQGNSTANSCVHEQASD